MDGEYFTNRFKVLENLEVMLENIFKFIGKSLLRTVFILAAILLITGLLYVCSVRRTFIPWQTTQADSSIIITTGISSKIPLIFSAWETSFKGGFSTMTSASLNETRPFTVWSAKSSTGSISMKPKLSSVPASIGSTVKEVERSLIPSTLPVPKTTPLSLIKKEQNRQCLNYLLEHNFIEYYYHPVNDDDNLDFTSKGITSKVRLDNKYGQPNYVLAGTTVDPNTIKPQLPAGICLKEILNFLPIMKAYDYDLQRYQLKFFKHVARLAGMEYYLTFGSLLGHIRFKGLPIPWDDDIDIAVEYVFINKFHRIFDRERRRYVADKNANYVPSMHIGKDRLKVFNSKHNKIGSYTHSFPYLDVFFFAIPDEDFYDAPEESMSSFVLIDGAHSSFSINISLTIMLPLKKERFLGIELYVPMNASKFLSLLHYSENACIPLKWWHRFEKYITGTTIESVECSFLEGFYEINKIM